MANRGVFQKKNCGFDVLEKDFDEGEIWEYSGSKTTRASKDSSGSSSAWPIPAAPRKIQFSSAISTDSNTISSSDAPLVQGSSAPIEIPDWSKIYGKKNCKKGNCGYEDHYSHDDDDDDDHDMVPPHEWVTKKLARSQISSFSVCEGMGRTLKGRDLSKVRNAVLTKTGFIE